MDNTDIKQRIILTTAERKQQTKKGMANGKVKTVGRVLLERVRPFRFAMLVSLQRKGIATKNLPFKTIVALFYNHFTVPSLGVEPLDISVFTNNLAFKVTEKTDYVKNIDNGRVHAAFSEVAGVAEYILNTFTNAREKYNTAKLYGYEPSQVMTDEEILQAKACNVVHGRLMRKQKGDNYIKVSNLTALFKWIIVGLVVYYIIKSS